MKPLKPLKSVAGMCEDCQEITRISLYKLFANAEYVIGWYPIGEHYLCEECADKIDTKEAI